MRRRDFLKAAAAGIILSGFLPPLPGAASQRIPHSGFSRPDIDEHISDYLHKMRNFDQPHEGDIHVEREQMPVLRSCVARLIRLQRTVGHGNFHLLGIDDGLAIGRNYPRVGEFSRPELDFLERIFYTDSNLYGFKGEKPIGVMTTRVNRKNVVKITNSGNYLYKGAPLDMYEKVRKHVGEKLCLTSGIRGVVKQFMLFLNKASKNNGNLSLASRSLAPPGYSFHGIADFDVGQAGYGALNFTGTFTTTEVFKKLDDLAYVSIRYPRDNLQGVRFEPWHIKVYPSA